MVELETEEAKKQAETLQKMKDEAKDERAENRKKENAKKKKITRYSKNCIFSLIKTKTRKTAMYKNCLVGKVVNRQSQCSLKSLSDRHLEICF